MEIKKDINKEVLKSDEEKVEDLAKDAEDLEKAVEKDIEDKVEKAEEVNDAKAEPIKSDIVASKKEFKNKQERDKEVVPGLEKAELEEGLTEAKKTLDDVYEDSGLESIWEAKWRELVPATGKAKTPIGEVMRCFAKVSHEYFQNGSILGKGYNNRSNYDAANDMDRALQANGLNDNELCKLWDKIWATRSEAAYDHYLAEFYEKFINKYLKNDTVSDKEFKEGQKQEDVEFPEVKKSEFVTEKLKPFTEKLELNEAAETQTEIKELLSDYLLHELEESEFMDNLAWRAEHDVPGYNHDWCAEEASRDYKEKEYEFIDELVEDLMAMCPLEESLKEKKLNESGEEDLRKDANSLSDYLSKNKLYCDLEDYDTGPLGIKIITFRVEGDWKHDHWYFNDLVKKWAKENGKEIWKIDENTVEEDGSDYYTADHKVYITDKETSDRLNSMRGLFAPKEESLKESKKLNERISAQSSVLAFIKDAFDIDESDIKNALRDQFGCKQSFINYGNSNMWITSYTDKKNAAKLRGFALSRGADVKLQLSHNADQKNAALNEDLYEVTINFPMAHVALYAMSVCEESGLDFSDIQKTYDALVRFFYDLKTPVMGMDESLKEDLMSSSWGSNFQSDVYNALADIAFKYYRKDINITEDDWNEAIEWFMTHFFEDEQIYDESLKESRHIEYIEKDLADKSGNNKIEDAYDENELTIIKDGNVWYCEHCPEEIYELVKKEMKKQFPELKWLYENNESLDESYFKLCGYTPGSAEDGIYSDRFDTYAVVEASDKKDAYKQFANIMSEKDIKDKGLYITSATEQEYKEYLDDLDYLNNLPDAPLDESKLDEAIPKEVAQALKNSNNQEIRNSGGSKYKIPGMPQYRTSDIDKKDALNKSNVDYEKAEFNKISKEEALNTYKTEPQNLLLIVSDDQGYGNIEQKAIWFEASGDRFGRVENVPDEKAPRRRDGSLITDTKYMTIKQLIDCADSCYWTNQRDVTRDPVLQDIRSKNPESRNYTGLNAKDIEQEYSPKNSGRYYVDNNVSRGVSPEYGWSSWTAVRQRRYDNLKARIEDLEAELSSGNLDRSEKINKLERLQGLKSELSQLEDTRAKAIGAEKDYNARRRYLTAEQAQRSTMKKFIDLKKAVENADWDLKNAQRNLDDVRKQGGTWSNDYDRRKVSNYTDQIRRLQAQIADYQRMIDELNTKLSSQQVSEEDAKAIADAEANFAEVQNRVQSQKDELNSILDKARARHQNTESLEEDLKVTINFDSFEPYGQAVDTYNRIKDANKLDEADSILEELYPDGIDEESLNDILAYSPEWLLNELGLADDEEKAMLDIK